MITEGYTQPFYVSCTVCGTLCSNVSAVAMLTFGCNACCEPAVQSVEAGHDINALLTLCVIAPLHD